MGERGLFLLLIGLSDVLYLGVFVFVMFRIVCLLEKKEFNKGDVNGFF